jgi:hypothetical protein
MSALLKFVPAIIVSLLFVSCGSTSTGPAPIGEAFVGPQQVNLRRELGPHSETVATVHHGDHLDIVGRRRLFVKVRTENGVVGWTDLRQLISSKQMADLRRLTAAAAKLPSQGAATVYDALNVHIEPSRAAPSFAQIREKQRVEVLAHRVVPREFKPATDVADLFFERPAKSKPVERSVRTRKSGSRIGPPPMPQAPRPPQDWLELSRNVLPAEPEPPEEKPPEKPLVLDDWSLVRLSDGRAGWCLTRNLIMAIPDEVAQYAEGHRITSYFPLADVRDGDQMKHYWLWTTLSRNNVPYEFDGFRLFVWSLRRHRYETAYIARNVKGYYPVSAHKADNERGEGATFSLILEEDGQVFRKTYVFNGYRVNLSKTEPYRLPSGEEPRVEVAAAESNTPAPQPWYSRLRNRVQHWFR